MYKFNQRFNHVSIEVSVRASKSTMPAFNRSRVSAVFSLSTSCGLRYLSGSRVPTFVFSQESLSRDASGGWVNENPMEKGKSAWSVSPLESGHMALHIQGRALWNQHSPSIVRVSCSPPTYSRVLQGPDAGIPTTSFLQVVSESLRELLQ